MKKGDIILVNFPFTNFESFKRRPAIVLYFGKNNIIVSFITSNITWLDNLDIYLEPNEYNRLKKPSLIKLNKITTIDIKLVRGKIGQIDNSEIKKININLKKLFKI